MAIVVRARAAGMDPQLEEAARDLGASALGRVPVRDAAADPARRSLSGALLAFALSFDDYVVTTFNAGVGSSTLPLYIYGKIKFGVTPEINAISTIIVAVTAVLVLVAWRLGRVRGDDRSWPSRRREAVATTRAGTGPPRGHLTASWTSEPRVGTPPGNARPACFGRPGSRSRPTKNAASRSRTSDSDARSSPACSRLILVHDVLYCA